MLFTACGGNCAECDFGSSGPVCSACNDGYALFAADKTCTGK